MVKVLIADRDPRSREFLLALCKSKGHKVEAAGNSGEALKKIQDEQINVMFLDCDLPGMNIIDLVSVINELKRDLHVIVTAEKLDSAMEIKVRTKKIFYYAKKPFEPDEIEKVMRAVSDKITSNELVKKGVVVEDEVRASEEKLFEGVEERAEKDEKKELGDLKEEIDRLKKQNPKELKSYQKQAFETISETGSAVVKKIKDTDRTISKAVGSVPVPKLEFLRKTLTKPIEFFDNSMTKLSKQVTNIFYHKEKNEF
ncbi:response regulator [candidate division KSB1 bacterium]